MTLSDYRRAESDGIGVKYYSQVATASEYYPFGMLLTDGNYSCGSYRYGFNGMEKDDEVKGTGNSYTTLFRQYDPRLGRWMSLDPAMAKYPGQSPYVAFNNNPIYFTDPSGDDPPEDDTHTVKSGESVWAIAKDHLGDDAANAEIAELTNNIIKWNGLNEDGDISPGQELTVVNPDNQDYVWSSGADSEPTVEPVTTEHTQITPEFDEFSENSSEEDEEPDRGVFTFGITGTAALGMLGGSFELGVSLDFRDEFRMGGYAQLEHAVGADLSGGLILNYHKPVSNENNFGIGDLNGWQESYNGGFLIFDGTYGGNSLYPGLNPDNYSDFHTKYKTYGFGLSIGSPIGFTRNKGYSWTTPTISF